LNAAAVRRRVVVRGRVQGVFFRDTVRRKAGRTGVAGWVRNRPDGAVEAVFEGERGPVDAMVALCRQGPPQAIVETVECVDEPVEGIRGFGVR
jgi:acylphosphatase